MSNQNQTEGVAAPEPAEQKTEATRQDWVVSSCRAPDVKLCEEFDKRVRALDGDIVRNRQPKSYISYAYNSRNFAYLYPKQSCLLIHLRDPGRQIKGLLKVSEKWLGEMIIGSQELSDQAIDMDAAIAKVEQAYKIVKEKPNGSMSSSEQKGKKLRPRELRLTAEEERELQREYNDEAAQQAAAQQAL